MTKMETIFSVVFFDGERETSIGDVVVHPALDYKSFQSILSHRIGISPNQFSIYFLDRKKPRKIPVTGKANFSAICRERDCCFLVVLKRSRDSRARRQRKKPEQQPKGTANVMLLKRNNDVNNAIMRNNNNRSINGVVNGGALVCEECLRAKLTCTEVGFHWCVYDAVTFGFRSPAGPIARPVKRFP